MGLLADWYKNTRADKKAEQAQGLMQRLYGQAGQPSSTTYSYNADTGEQGQGQMQGPLTGGSGLLGGDLTQPQFDAQLQSGLTGIYGAKGLMQQRSVQDMANQGAMRRHMTTSPQQAAQIQNQKAATMAQIGNNNFDNMLSLQGKYDTEIRPYEVTVQNAQAVDNMVDKSSYTDAATQQFIISKALSTIRPGEAQMEGDVRNLARSAGFSGEMADAWTYLTTNAANDPKILRGLHRMIRKQAMLDQQRINSVRGKISTAYRLNPEQMKVLTWGDATSDQQYVAPLEVDIDDLTLDY